MTHCPTCTCELIRLGAWLACYREMGNVVQQDDPSGRADANRGARRMPAAQAQDAGRTREPALRESSAKPVCGVENRDSPPLLPLLGASAADLLAWRTHIGGTLSDASINTTMAHVREFYAWLADEGYRPDNPARRIPVPPKPGRLPRPISEADLWHAFSLAPPRIRPWIALAAGCGLRCKEIALLRRDRVLDTAARPHLLIASDATKGTQRERVVPLPGFVLGELRAAGLPSRGWVFPRHDGRAGPNTAGIISQICADHFRACGADATLHMCRHRYLTLAQQATKDIMLVKTLAGHSSVTTTEGYMLVSVGDEAWVMAEGLPVPGPRLHVVGE